MSKHRPRRYLERTPLFVAGFRAAAALRTRRL